MSRRSLGEKEEGGRRGYSRGGRWGSVWGRQAGGMGVGRGRVWPEMKIKRQAGLERWCFMHRGQVFEDGELWGISSEGQAGLDPRS